MAKANGNTQKHTQRQLIRQRVDTVREVSALSAAAVARDEPPFTRTSETRTWPCVLCALCSAFCVCALGHKADSKQTERKQKERVKAASNHHKLHTH